ncbi:hypothetical protein HanLR1_Chr10g0366651 [Helianthus annuus]|nr:hypothetical protein HanLR1_Chr10g0366651 [Helianthus annuus]
MFLFHEDCHTPTDGGNIGMRRSRRLRWVLVSIWHSGGWTKGPTGTTIVNSLSLYK